MTVIRDPRNGDGVHVDTSYRMFVNSKSSPVQHIISEEEENAYQVSGETAWVAASGAENVLHLQNTSTDKNVIITYIRLQVVTDLTVPAAGSYFTIETGETYSSGGTAIVPVNMHIGSAKTASTAVYHNNPTLAGTSTIFEKWLPASNGDTETYSKEGSIIINPTKTVKVLFTPAASHTGTAYARMSFYMEKPGD